MNGERGTLESDWQAWMEETTKVVWPGYGDI